MPTRRSVLAASLVSPLVFFPAAARQATRRWQYPIGWPDEPPLAGFVNRHGFQCEHAEFYPGWWHTGENYYAVDGGETAGAVVYAVAAGDVVYADFDYPGRVVLIDHGDGLISQYGHLSYDLAVTRGDRVECGDLIGSVLERSDWAPRSHLHFEVRAFITEDTVNGSDPQYGVNCGKECPPGPGYWPMDAPDLPVDLGWYNPTHVIAARIAPPFPAQVERDGDLVLHDGVDGAIVGTRPVAAGDQLDVIEAETGAVDVRETSAEGTVVWYRTGDGWFRGWEPFDEAVQNDGRMAALRPVVVPLI